MKTNNSGIELIKHFEGFEPKAYRCPAGVWTIGYGHTSEAGNPKVIKGMKVTAREASDILARDLEKFETAVMKTITRTPSENQFSAMVSLCYNIGPGAFAKSSVARLFNAGDVKAAADAFMRWNKAAGRVLPGLLKRRVEERHLFLTPDRAASAPPGGQPKAQPGEQ
jgi:lysozyme